MATTNAFTTDIAGQARIAREAVLIAQGEAEIDAGLGIGLETLETWFDRLEHEPHATLPGARATVPSQR